MYPLTPRKVYVLDRVYQDPRCVARLERMLVALACDPELTVVTDDNLGDVVAEQHALFSAPEGAGSNEHSYDRPLMFTTIELRRRQPDLRELLPKCPAGTSLRDLQKIYGYLALAVDQHPHQKDQQQDMVCWPTINFGTAIGCSHGCAYCGEGRGGRVLTIGLNLEEYLEQIVGPMIEYNPWNRVFRMILNGSDLMTLEPEYGLFDLYTRKLAEFEDRYGHFHTITDNVEWLADLEHKDRLVGVWSTTCEAVARDLEPGGGTAVARIEAARKVQDMGIPVRYKYKPMIPVKNWQEEYDEALKCALTLTQPESIGFAIYMWNTYDSMSRTLPLDQLDPHCLKIAEEAQATNMGRQGPFPHELRRDIYRELIASARKYSDDVLLYVCTESRRMWDDLGDELGQDPRWYHCGCGSVALPGRHLGLNGGLRYSTYHPTPV